MTDKSEGRAAPSKRTRTATVSYPYHPLDLCIKFAEAIKQIGNGRQDVDKSTLAAHLKVDEKSGDFAQKIASSKTYGLIDGKTALQLTDAARSYFFPTENPEKERAAALLKFFSSPGAFNAMIEAHDGSRPPTNEIMGNVLGQKYGIPESWKLRVATYFMRSGATAGAIDADGFLRYKAKLQSVGGAPALNGAQPVPHRGNGSAIKSPAQEALDQEEHDHQGDQSGVIVWKYPFQGKSLRIETPENLTKEIWEKLNRYIQVLKP